MFNRNWCGEAVGAVVERLEERRLLAASVEFVNGTLIVHGTKGNDVIELSAPLPTQPPVDGPRMVTWMVYPEIVVKINGQAYGSYANVDRTEVRCGRGDDRVVGATVPREMLIYGGRGADTIFGGGNRDTIYGQAGNDAINGRGMDDQVFGGAGADTINGGAEADTLFGGGGRDTINCDRYDVVNGGRGQDRINLAKPPVVPPGEPAYEIDANGILRVIGTEGDDEIAVHYIGPDTYTLEPVTDPYFIAVVNGQVSNAIADELVKGIRLEGRGGNDNLFAGYGGAGIADASEHDLPTTLLGGVGNDTISGGKGTDHVEGGDGQDFIAGGQGDDVLMGDAGNDTIRGSSGKDVVHGGEGDDGVGGGTDVREGTDPGDSVFGDGGDDVFMTQGDDASEHKDRTSEEETAEVVWPPEEPWLVI